MKLFAIGFWTFNSLEVHIVGVQKNDDDNFDGGQQQQHNVITTELPPIVITEPKLAQKFWHILPISRNKIIVGGIGVTVYDDFGRSSQDPGYVLIYELVSIHDHDDENENDDDDQWYWNQTAALYLNKTNDYFAYGLDYYYKSSNDDNDNHQQSLLLAVSSIANDGSDVYLYELP